MEGLDFLIITASLQLSITCCFYSTALQGTLSFRPCDPVDSDGSKLSVADGDAIWIVWQAPREVNHMEGLANLKHSSTIILSQLFSL